MTLKAALRYEEMDVTGHSKNFDSDNKSSNYVGRSILRCARLVEFVYWNVPNAFFVNKEDVIGWT
jgi:hypothetical protein